MNEKHFVFGIGVMITVKSNFAKIIMKCTYHMRFEIKNSIMLSQPFATSFRQCKYWYGQICCFFFFSVISIVHSDYLWLYIQALHAKFHPNLACNTKSKMLQSTISFSHIKNLIFFLWVYCVVCVPSNGAVARGLRVARTTGDLVHLVDIIFAIILFESIHFIFIHYFQSIICLMMVSFFCFAIHL